MLESSKDTLLDLFESLISVLEQMKKIKQEKIASDLLFNVFSMNRNNMSKSFSDSARAISPEKADILLEQGLIQIIPSDEKKYALTFTGIVRAIEIKHNITLENQLLEFVKQADQKFNTGEQTALQWDEKLSTLSLLLLASTSAASAIRLNNQNNKEVLTQVFDETLACLKEYGFISPDVKIKATKSRDESPISALMSRLNSLSRRTSHYYTNLPKDSGYFFDIEKDGGIDEGRLVFLFKRVFDSPDQNRGDYKKMCDKFTDISYRYSPRFLGRSSNTIISSKILRELKNFVDLEMWRP
jgi:hypothetical protein